MVTRSVGYSVILTRQTVGRAQGLEQAAYARYSRRVSRIVGEQRSVEIVVCTTVATKLQPPRQRRCGGGATAAAAARLPWGSGVEPLFPSTHAMLAGGTACDYGTWAAGK